MIKTVRSAKNKLSKSRRSARKTRKANPVMRGGDAGRFVLPAEYFGKNSGAYVEDPGSLAGQIATSRGSVHPSGLWAGPNLKPAMSGGGCGCRRKSRSRSHSKSRRRHSRK